jgi:hypothetical protein
LISLAPDEVDATGCSVGIADSPAPERFCSADRECLPAFSAETPVSTGAKAIVGREPDPG